MTTVFLIDPRPLFRVGLRAVLSASGRFEILGEASDLSSALCRIEDEPPDVATMALETGDDTTAIQEAHRRFPTVFLAVFTELSSDEEAVEVIEAGAAAYLPRAAGPEMIEHVLISAANGEYPVASLMLREGVASWVLARFREIQKVGSHVNEHVAPLTSRETKLLSCMAGGGTASDPSVPEEDLQRTLVSIARKLAANGHVRAVTRAVAPELLSGQG